MKPGAVRRLLAAGILFLSAALLPGQENEGAAPPAPGTAAEPSAQPGTSAGPAASAPETAAQPSVQPGTSAGPAASAPETAAASETPAASAPNPPAAVDSDSCFTGVGGFYDTVIIINTDGDSAPSPIKNIWVASFKFQLGERWRMLSQLGFYYAEYFFRDGIAYPAEIEYADATGTLNILLDCAFLYAFPLAKKFTLLTGTGPALAFNIPISSYGNAPNSEVGSYFMSKGRFLNWQVLGVFEWHVVPFLDFCVRARVLLPVHRLWDGDGLPIYDGLGAGLGFGFLFKF